MRDPKLNIVTPDGVAHRPPPSATSIDYVTATTPYDMLHAQRSSAPSIDHHTIVPAGHGYAFFVRAKTRFRIIDLHGEQIVDFLAWVATPEGTTDRIEKLSMAYTRYRLRGATPAIDECLYTNRDRPLFRITADCVKMHDMTFPCCYPELYEKAGLKGHRACATNIAEAMGKFGMRSHLEVPDPFNIFQNSPFYALKGGLGCSRAEDYIEFEAMDNAVVAVSSCPYDLEGLNGGKVTDVAVAIVGDPDK
jgi:uncharacterized protein YcgI (DUF1989 family)